jgi:hypothetical protein
MAEDGSDCLEQKILQLTRAQANTYFSFFKKQMKMGDNQIYKAWCLSYG